jgi:taspase (threonine aspartase 1)
MSAHHQSSYIIAAHGGAGYHPPASDSSLKRSLRAAISSALPAFSGATTSRGGSSSEPSSLALDATSAVIVALEDNPDFNAGYGSNLTFDGQVECDASLMVSTEQEQDQEEEKSESRPPAPSFSFSFGSVGAVRGVRNPVLLARCVLEGRRGGRRRQGREREGMGRVPPLTLVGEGAAQFARERGVRVVGAPEEMVAPRARQEWRVWRERCRRDVGEVEPGSSEDLPLGVGEGLGEEEGSEALRVRMDTVGAVVLVGGASEIGQRPEVAAGVSRCVVSPTDLFAYDPHATYFLPPVSSGGILLKHSGRVGEVSRRNLSLLLIMRLRLKKYLC